MELRTLLIVGLSGVVGFTVGRAASSPSASVDSVCTAAPAPRVRVEPVPPREPILAALPDSDTADRDDGDSQDVGEAFVALGRRTVAQAHERNLIEGHVVELTSRDPLAGVTVIVSSPTLAEAQTAITDASGNYEIIGLASGSYLVTFYYAEVTLTQDGVAVSEFAPTVLQPQAIDTTYRWEPTYTVNIQELEQ